MENQPWGSTLYDVLPGTHTSFKTERQQVDLITNPSYGRMLLLDGVLQSTTSDESIYHKALVGALRPYGRVLIAGGGEGFTAREVLQSNAVNLVQWNDWDAELVEHCRRVEGWCPEIWKDRRLHYSSKNIIAFCEQTIQTFDCILLDLLDINTDKDNAFTTHLLHWVQMVSEPTARFVMNIGRSKETADTYAAKLKGWVVELEVPSFQEPWYLVHWEQKG